MGKRIGKVIPVPADDPMFKRGPRLVGIHRLTPSTKNKVLLGHHGHLDDHVTGRKEVAFWPQLGSANCCQLRRCWKER
jgi:hypothetical protein